MVNDYLRYDTPEIQIVKCLTIVQVMNIESDSPARTLLPALAELPGHLIWRARARVVAALEDVLPDNVDIHGYAALLALAGGATRSQQALARTVAVSGTTMMRVATDLADRGLVQRVRNPDDRRSYALTRTPEGAAAARTWRRYAEDLEESVTAGFTVREREDLRTLLLLVAAGELDPDTPEPLRESIAFLITRVQFRMHRDFQAALEPIGIDPAHFGVLAGLDGSGPLSQSVLARAFGISGAHLVQLVDDLERRGFVARRRLESDRRAQVVEVLPPGRDAMRKAAPLAERTADERLAPRTAAQASRLVTLLQRLVTAP
jgi:DNA-binding MarR family transcriptional regulator